MAKKKHKPAPHVEFVAPEEPAPEPEAPAAEGGLDYANWEAEKEKLFNEILIVLREQRDQQQELTVAGFIDVQPQAFTQGPHLVLGPVRFGDPFEGEPVITFGQHPKIMDSNVVLSPTATAYKPFLVQPYVYNLIWESGKVAGFYIGLYAISIPDQGSLANLIGHVVSWHAAGKATAYKDERTTEAWTEAGDHASTDFLEETSQESEL